MKKEVTYSPALLRDVAKCLRGLENIKVRETRPAESLPTGETPEVKVTVIRQDNQPANDSQSA